jgi:hypothetical protein
VDFKLELVDFHWWINFLWIQWLKLRLRFLLFLELLVTSLAPEEALAEHIVSPVGSACSTMLIVLVTCMLLVC